MKHTILSLARIAVALLFIFSGIVKCIDPIGGAIKIEDYFMAWGIDAPESVNVVLSFAQNILEFMVGFMLLLDVFVPFSSFIVMCFMIVYTPLTLYIALVNPVTDCGCFGDAVKLSNWATFYKNLVFLPLSILVFVNRSSFTSQLRPLRKGFVVCLGMLVSFCVSFEGLTDEPLIDFRPYKVGTDIRRAMEIPADAPLPEYKTTFLLQKNGEVREFDENSYPYDDSTWVYVDTKTEQISEGYVPPITDFTLIDEQGNLLTEELLNKCGSTYLVISPDVEKMESETIGKIASFAAQCADAGVDFYICTASSGASLRRVADEAQMGFSFLAADETMLKTIMRCNGGLMAIDGGVIVAKYHIDHLPKSPNIASPASTYLLNKEQERARLIVITTILALGFLLVILYTKHKRKSK